MKVEGWMSWVATTDPTRTTDAREKNRAVRIFAGRVSWSNSFYMRSAQRTWAPSLRRLNGSVPLGHATSRSISAPPKNNSHAHGEA